MRIDVNLLILWLCRSVMSAQVMVIYVTINERRGCACRVTGHDSTCYVSKVHASTGISCTC